MSKKVWGYGGYNFLRLSRKFNRLSEKWLHLCKLVLLSLLYGND